MLVGRQEERLPLLRWRPTANRFVSIIIPSRTPQIAARCLAGLTEKPAGVPFEIILVVTGGPPESWRHLRAMFGGSRVEFVAFGQQGETFNFQSACNAGRKKAGGDAFLFLNDDVAISEEDWLSGLLQWLDLDHVGAVGPKLLYPDGRIQHTGVVVGMAGFASHVFRWEREGSHFTSPFVSPERYRNCSAVTAACLLTPTRVFDEVGGFNEQFTLLFGDVDFCLRLRQAGYRLVYTPDVRLVHAESSTRQLGGKDRIPRSDWELFTRLWLPVLARGDPFYNPNLSVADEHPDFKKGERDTPIFHNEKWMARLPNTSVITLPHDLLSSLVEANERQ